ncbi:MAG: hypothetical protein QG673_1618 [Pseudomonadota bacterium]|nr:hypothetical protein [Pseudomonadota bacterium]
MFRELNNYRLCNRVNNISGSNSVRGNIIDQDIIAERHNISGKYEKAVEKSAIKEEGTLVAGSGISFANPVLGYAPEGINAEGACASEVGEKVSQLFEGSMAAAEMQAAAEEKPNKSDELELESKTKDDEAETDAPSDGLKASGYTAHSSLTALGDVNSDTKDSDTKLKNAFAEITAKNQSSAENLKNTISQLGLRSGGVGAYLSSAIDRLVSPSLIAMKDGQKGVFDDLISGTGNTVSAMKSLLENTQPKVELLRFAFSFLNEQLVEEKDTAYIGLRSTINNLAAETEKFATAVANILTQLEYQKNSSANSGSSTSSSDNQTGSSSVSSQAGVKGSDRNTEFVQGSPAEYHAVSLLFVLLPISEAMSKQGVVLANQLDELTDTTNTVLASQADADETTNQKCKDDLADQIKQIKKQRHKRGIFGICFGALDIVSAIVSVASSVKDAATLNFAAAGSDIAAATYLVTDGLLKMGAGVILATGVEEAVHGVIKEISDKLGTPCMGMKHFQKSLDGVAMYGVGEICAEVIGGDAATWQMGAQTGVSAMMAMSGLSGAYDAMFAAETVAQQALITAAVAVEVTTVACSIATMVQTIRDGGSDKYLQFASMSPVMAFVLFLSDIVASAQQKSDNSFVSDVLPMMEILLLAGISPALAFVFFLSEVEAKSKDKSSGPGPIADLFRHLGGNGEVANYLNEHIPSKVREQIVSALETVVCMAAGMGTSYLSSKTMASTTERYLAKSPNNKTETTKILEKLKNNMSAESWAKLQKLSSIGSGGMTIATGLMKGLGISVMLNAVESTVVTLATYKESYEQRKAAIDAEQQVKLQQLFNQWASNAQSQLQQTSQTVSNTLKSNMDAQNGFFKTIQNMIRDFSSRNPHL